MIILIFPVVLPPLGFGRQIFSQIKRKYRSSDGRCPYCKSASQCVHWDGISWIKHKTEYSSNLPDFSEAEMRK